MQYPLAAHRRGANGEYISGRVGIPWRMGYPGNKVVCCLGHDTSGKYMVGYHSDRQYVTRFILSVEFKRGEYDGTGYQS